MSSDIALVMESSELAASRASRTTSQPPVWPAFTTWLFAAIVGQLAVFAAFVFAGVGVGVVLGASGAEASTIGSRTQAILSQPLLMMLLSLIPCQLGILGVVLLAARRAKEGWRDCLGLVPPKSNAYGSLRLATMAGLTMSVALTSVIVNSLWLGNPPSDPISATVNNGSWWAIALLSVVMSVLPALIEEILFRGYVQHRLLQRWSPAVAIGVSTLLFAVLHFDSLQHIIAVIPLGIVTGVLAYRTGSVKPGMIVHAVHNVGAVAFGLLARILSPVLGEEVAGLVILAAIAAGFLVGLPAVISLFRGKPAKPAEALSFQPQYL